MVFMGVRDIIEKIEDWWPWHAGDKDGPEVNPDLHPVLLIPGIGGSILNAVDEHGKKERIWVRLFEADHEFRSKLFSFYDPATGRTNSLDKKTRIEVPDDRFGLYSCDILDPDVILRLDSVYYFHDLIKQMKSWGYKEGTTLFGFGYDFRQSNRLSEHMDALKAKLEIMYEASGGKKVDILTHSMGGLLVKSFLALHHEVFEKYVNSWICVTAPFQGAPGFIMDCLLTGVEFVKGWQRELFVAKWSMHQLLIECPSVYELMASPHFDWSEPPELRVWRKQAENGKENVKLESFGPKENVHVMMAALEENKLIYNGDKIPLPLNKDIVEWAVETQRIMHTAKLPKGVKFYNLFGTTCDTPYHACYGSENTPLEVLTQIPYTEAEFFCVDGDGTVPCESAMADGLEAEARVGIPGDHRGILNDERFFRVMRHWLKAEEDADPFYNPLTDYVIIPKKEFEFDSHKEECIAVAESTDDDNDKSEAPEKGVFVATVETGSGSSSDTRAEAHAQVHHKPGPSDDHQFEVSTIGVAEGPDKEETREALDQVMAAASEEAKAANTKGKKVVSEEACYLKN